MYWWLNIIKKLKDDSIAYAKSNSALLQSFEEEEDDFNIEYSEDEEKNDYISRPL